MPELRKDPILSRWVIISPERGKRPIDFPAAKKKFRGGFCPFCPGNESKTPPEVLALRSTGIEPNSPGWSLRVVPNRYPALMVEGELVREGEGMYDRISGIGAHEVIIETPDHNQTYTSMTNRAVENIFRAFQERIRDLKQDNRFKYFMIFKNHGESAGASLEHSHSQLIALPIVPKRVMEEMQGAHYHFNYKERCIFCDIIRQEMKVGQQERVVCHNDSFVALAPFASRFPFEVWILPLRHVHHFENMQDNDVGELAGLFQEIMQRLEGLLDNPDYNFILHNAPVGDAAREYYHWHLEIFPKLTHVAGFEWGSGFYINPTPPEMAAQLLRDFDLGDYLQDQATYASVGTQ
ncbi:MAG: galactose-1-phosphate uridylyltransferase [Deltaproteobacteria bacterium]|nr:galactose-1-phosphate uridylyltransferase [Deltaproteobacteria bacterium]MBW2309431.1 galactose-1-phosphate uridylyltransferase [Deltaproteobacteria bacterium]